MMRAAVTRRVRWTVADYFRMAEAGLFDDRRVELIEGEVIEVPAQAHAHRLSISKISRLLNDAFAPSKYWVVIQGTLVLSKFSAPDPDFHVFDVPEGTSDDQLPLPFLVIEASDTTYRKDSGPKLRAYARAGIPDYWIVNLSTRRVEVYRRPENPIPGRRSAWRYADLTTHGPGAALHPLLRRQLTFPVDAMLP
jgi:Uma2 family endonuclease